MLSNSHSRFRFNAQPRVSRPGNVHVVDGELSLLVVYLLLLQVQTMKWPRIGSRSYKYPFFPRIVSDASAGMLVDFSP
jgi:hypothetical protein